MLLYLSFYERPLPFTITLEWSKSNTSIYLCSVFCRICCTECIIGSQSIRPELGLTVVYFLV